MKLILITLTVLMLTSCGTISDNTYLIISCGEASGLGSMLAGGGTTRKMTHSEPGHVFTPQELELFDRKCPVPATEGELLNLLIKERLNAG